MVFLNVEKDISMHNNLLIGVVLHTLRTLLEFHIHIMLEIYARDKLILNSKRIELL